MFDNLEILQFPDERLRRLSHPVETFNKELKALADKMLEIMYQSNGIGLAAPQVNQTIRLIVVDVSEDRNTPCIFINPKIKQPSGSVDSSEGCLSVPGFYEKVDRFNYIKYEATDIDGNKFVSEATELLAVCIQHEIDHLDGKLFVDYLSDMKRSKIQKGLIKQNNNNSDIQRKENPYIK